MFVTEEDVVIVGAGAAGIAAGLALSRLGVRYLILEAMDRVGGRAFTDVDTFGRPWDCGAHWIYSADINPLRTIADRLGHRYETQTTDWVSAIHLGDRWANAGEVEAAHEFIASEFARIAEQNDDLPIAEVMTPSQPWSNLMRDRLAQFGASEPENISVVDYGRFEDTNLSYAVSDGFGALFEAMCRGLPVRTECEVIRIDVRDDCVEVEGRDDVLIRAGAAIVTVSTEVLRAGSIAFSPALPDTTIAALDGFGMGCAEKVALGLKSDPFGVSEPSRVQLLTGAERGDRHVFFEIVPNGRPLVVAHLGGDLARNLVVEGEAAMIDFAVAALGSAYGSDAASQVVDGAATSWYKDPFVRGAYAMAKPGNSDARATLSEPLAERVYLAGEAASQTHFSTCHGAYVSGLEAAHRAAEMLGHWSAEMDALWLPGLD